MSTYFESAHARLKKLILDGEISAAEPLSERALAARLGLGRTPVREALKELTRDGLVTVIPGRGTFLKQITLDEIREIYEVRLGLEGIAAYLVAERGAPPEILAYGEKFERHLNDNSVDVTTIQTTGADFHRDVVRASGNKLLSAMFESLHDQIEVSLHLIRTYERDRVKPHALIEHIRILDAMVARNPVEAQRAMYENLSNALAARVRIFALRFGASPAS